MIDYKAWLRWLRRRGPTGPVARLERHRQRRVAEDGDYYTPAEVHLGGSRLVLYAPRNGNRARDTLELRNSHSGEVFVRIKGVECIAPESFEVILD